MLVRIKSFLCDWICRPTGKNNSIFKNLIKSLGQKAIIEKSPLPTNHFTMIEETAQQKDCSVYLQSFGLEWAFREIRVIQESQRCCQQV
jgi:hypothetical protein